MKLKIAILGTRGIPNHYGGYEQAMSYIAPGLAEKGHDVTVYNSQQHPYREKTWRGVRIVRCKDPEKHIGAAGQFLYDWNCIRHARGRHYDVILMMGYTSSSVWGRFYPRKTIVISNMDGLEWKRSKYSVPVRKFLQYAEKWAVQYSDYHIADSPAIRDYLQEKYGIRPRFIPYGAAIREEKNTGLLQPFGLSPFGYYLLIARMEPENHIDTILDGFCQSATGRSFVVVGNTETAYGKKMLQKYRRFKNILFTGALFDQDKLHALRQNCQWYFHGHSVGGTNPSLLEAMASGAPVAVHDNKFNQAVTGDDACYFSSAADVARIITADLRDEGMIRRNLEKIKACYNWPSIIDQYESYIMECYQKGKQ